MHSAATRTTERAPIIHNAPTAHSSARPSARAPRARRATRDADARPTRDYRRSIARRLSAPGDVDVPRAAQAAGLAALPAELHAHRRDRAGARGHRGDRVPAARRRHARGRACRGLPRRAARHDERPRDRRAAPRDPARARAPLRRPPRLRARRAQHQGDPQLLSLQKRGRAVVCCVWVPSVGLGRDGVRAAAADLASPFVSRDALAHDAAAAAAAAARPRR